jgi:hypothetical protein
MCSARVDFNFYALWWILSSIQFCTVHVHSAQQFARVGGPCSARGVCVYITRKNPTSGAAFVDACMLACKIEFRILCGGVASELCGGVASKSCVCVRQFRFRCHPEPSQLRLRCQTTRFFLKVSPSWSHWGLLLLLARSYLSTSTLCFAV